MQLPEFRYHPDPQATGAVATSDEQCRRCDEARGFIYTGPVYAAEELDGCLCPWCIADGSGAEEFAAEFTDVGWGVPSDVPEAVLQEVSTRTPGFSGWQQEHWLYHCGDAAAFLGRVGWVELQSYPDAIESLQTEHDVDYVRALDIDGEATAYLFRCRHCDRHIAYADSA